MSVSAFCHFPVGLICTSIYSTLLAILDWRHCVNGALFFVMLGLVDFCHVLPIFMDVWIPIVLLLCCCVALVSWFKTQEIAVD